MPAEMRANRVARTRLVDSHNTCTPQAASRGPKDSARRRAPVHLRLRRRTASSRQRPHLWIRIPGAAAAFLLLDDDDGRHPCRCRCHHHRSRYYEHRRSCHGDCLRRTGVGLGTTSADGTKILRRQRVVLRCAAGFAACARSGEGTGPDRRDYDYYYHGCCGPFRLFLRGTRALNRLPLPGRAGEPTCFTIAFLGIYNGS